MGRGDHSDADDDQHIPEGECHVEQPPIVYVSNFKRICFCGDFAQL